MQLDLENNRDTGSPGDHMMHERERRGRVLYPWSHLVSSILSRHSVLRAMLAGVGFWLGLWLCVSVQPITGAGTVPSISCPGGMATDLEELLFRGYCQGQLRQRSWGRQSWRGLTVANSLTSLLFVVGHWWAHPPLWVIAVLLPSLVLGYCRDRYLSVYPCIVLHAILQCRLL